MTRAAEHDIESGIEAALTTAPRQRRSREKMDRLFKAGFRLISKHGYDGMKIADLVREADCPVSTFYQRFRDKESFLAMLQLRAVQALKAGLERDRFFERLGEATLEAAVDMIVAGLTRPYVEGGALIRELMRLAPSSPAIRKPMVAWGPYLRKRTREALRPHFPRIARPDPEAAIDLALETCFGLLNNLLIYDGGPYPLGSPELAREMRQLILGYLAASDPKPGQ